MTDTARNILAVMGEQQIKRVVFVSAFGVGDSWKTLPVLFRAFIKVSNIKIGYADHDGVDALARKNNTDWTLVRAVGLNDKSAGALGPLHTTEVGGAKPGALSVTRAEVASFCIDSVETNEWIHRAPHHLEQEMRLPTAAARSLAGLLSSRRSRNARAAAASPRPRARADRRHVPPHC